MRETLSAEKILKIQEKTEILIAERVESENISSSFETRQKLVELQIEIFVLDEYAETNLELDKEKVETQWEKIEKATADAGIPKNQVNTALSELREFLEMEKAMREGLEIEKIPMEKFYRLKSCDVRLLQNIVQFQKKNHLPKTDPNASINILEEVLDDIDDFWEDQEISGINSNRLLEGYKKAKDLIFDEYIDYLKRQKDSSQKTEALKKLAHLQTTTRSQNPH